MKAVANYPRIETTDGFTEGCQTKMEMPEQAAHGLRNVDVYRRKALLGVCSIA